MIDRGITMRFSVMAAMLLLAGCDPADESTSGRYQIVISPRNEGDLFLLDTSTGQAWRGEVADKRVGKPVVWAPTFNLSRPDEKTEFESLDTIDQNSN